MAKYVCDFGQVTAVGNKLIEAANSLLESANKFNSSIESSLSTWNGNSKSAFMSQSSAQVEKIIEKAKYIQSFGEFIIKAAESIQQLEEELGSTNL